MFLVSQGWVLGQAESWAREDTVPGSRYVSSRGAALGDAVLPLVDDATSLFYNPAGIARAKQIHFEPIQFQLGVNSFFVNTLNKDSIKALSLSSYSPNLVSHPGKFPGYQVAVFPNYVMKGFAFGLLYQRENSATYNSSAGTTRYRSRYQLIPTAGGALSLASGVVKLGYSLQLVNTAVGDVTTAGSSGLGWNKNLSQGLALSHTVGFALTFPYQYLPAINVVGRNLGRARYTSTTFLKMASPSSGTPGPEKMTFDGSLSMSPRVYGTTTFNMVAEYRDMLGAVVSKQLSRVALGFELNFNNLFFLRWGLGGGYPNAGFGIHRPHGDISFAWYSEETGTGYRSERDIKAMLQYQFRAF
jgi:hypothetical protein